MFPELYDNIFNKGWRLRMSVQLLDKTRKINKLLHNNNSSKVVFNDICEVLTEILNSNVLVISKKGKVLGVSPGRVCYKS